jgi:hypothetical protein
MKNHFSTLGFWLMLFTVAIALFPATLFAASPVDTDLTWPLLGIAGTVNAIFQTRTLTAAVNKMRPVKTHVLDLIFGRKKRQLSGLFAWDIKSSSERLLKNIRVSDAAQVTDKTGRKTVTCQAPRFAEKRHISAADLDSMRAFGEQVAPELMKERVADEQSDMRGDVDRTREFMAIKALSGQVVDESGAVIVDYNFPAAQKPVLAGVAMWTDAGSDPVVNIRAWKKYIGDRVGVDKFVAICGSKAMDALISNPAALELLKYNAGKQLADEGRIAFLAGCSIEEYFGTYKDAAGARQQLIPDNVFAIVGISSENAAELYAPVIDLKADGGVGKGKAADLFFSKSWEVEDPSGRWVKVESRPLPVLFQPECVIWAEVCAA